MPSFFPRCSARAEPWSFPPCDNGSRLLVHRDAGSPADRPNSRTADAERVTRSLTERPMSDLLRSVNLHRSVGGRARRVRGPRTGPERTLRGRGVVAELRADHAPQVPRRDGLAAGRVTDQRGVPGGPAGERVGVVQQRDAESRLGPPGHELGVVAVLDAQAQVVNRPPRLPTTDGRLLRAATTGSALSVSSEMTVRIPWSHKAAQPASVRYAGWSARTTAPHFVGRHLTPAARRGPAR